MDLTAPSIVGFDVLGLHPVRPERAEEFDGFDLSLTLSTGDVRVFGVRTAGLALAAEPARSRGWLSSYVAVRVDFEPAEVKYWSFDEPMWIGPEPRPCLVWSNAECFTRAGIEYLVRAGRVDKIVSGRDGQGLPALTDLPLLR